MATWAAEAVPGGGNTPALDCGGRYVTTQVCANPRHSPPAEDELLARKSQLNPHSKETQQSEAKGRKVLGIKSNKGREATLSFCFGGKPVSQGRKQKL